MRRIKGFTMIELLVVISTVALLISILAPALSNVKDQARSIVCMTNMKELTLFWNIYAVEYNGRICGSYNYYGSGAGINGEFDDKASWVWAAWAGRQNRAIIANPYINAEDYRQVSQEEKIEGIKRGSLWPYSNNLEIYHCPSDRNNNDHVRSYVIGDNLNGQRARVDLSATWEIFKRIEDVPRPSESYVFLEESDPKPYNMDSFLFNAKNGTWQDPLAVWHNGSSSFSFADGHVEQRSWSKETQEHFNAADDLDDFLAYLHSWHWMPETNGGFDDIYWMEAGWAR